MGSGKKLSDPERAQVDVLRRIHPEWSHRRIGAEIGRSHMTVGRYLRDRDGHGRRKRSGRPLATTERDRRAIVNLARRRQSAPKVLAELNLNCTARTVLRVLKADPNMVFMKHQGKPPLTKKHQADRLETAWSKVSWPLAEWRKVVWSDEKKWNLDGPDGCHYYWHDLRRAPEVFSRRQHGGGSVMTWGAFSGRGQISLAFVEGRQDAVAYQDLLGEHLLPKVPLVIEENWIFQQDNASCHSAGSTRAWFEANGVTVMPWPARSPDLNPIENLWGWMVQRVYANGRQFAAIPELREAIREAWEAIPLRVMEDLVGSMTNRLREVIMKKGGITKY